jgi:trehalose synthase
MTESQPTLDDYRAVAPAGTIDILRRLSERAPPPAAERQREPRGGRGRGNLHGLVPLLEEVGVESTWEALDGDGTAAAIGARLHHALQGGEDRVPDELFDEFRRFTRARGAALDPLADMVVTHDALAAGLVEARPQEGAWVWRCHLDVSRPQRRAWTFLRQYVVKYDAAVFSLPAFAQRLPIPQFMIYPAIDPLSDKNRGARRRRDRPHPRRARGRADKPILLQVGRFDRFRTRSASSRRTGS